MSNITEQLMRRYPIVSEQVDSTELSVLLVELEALLATGHEGSVVELGCYVGTSSLFIRRLLDRYDGVYDFHVYDSFAGLPPKTVEDQSVAGDQFVTGELHATKKSFVTNFKKAGLICPTIHKGWFSELGADDIPDRIFFAFLDGDYFDSVRDSLRLVTPKLQPGAVVIVDDYMNEALPGAARAVDAWARQFGQTVHTRASLAIVHWQ